MLIFDLFGALINLVLCVCNDSLRLEKENGAAELIPSVWPMFPILLHSVRIGAEGFLEKKARKVRDTLS